MIKASIALRSITKHMQLLYNVEKLKKNTKAKAYLSNDVFY